MVQDGVRGGEKYERGGWLTGGWEGLLGLGRRGEEWRSFDGGTYL